MYREVLFCAMLCACVASKVHRTYSVDDAEDLFEKFIVDHNRHYKDQHEKQMRFKIFKNTLNKINSLNAGQEGPPAFGINQFSDYTDGETANLFGYAPTVEGNLCNTLKTDNDIPDAQAPVAFDWRDRNVVSPARTQGSCGSCYAISSVEHIESQYALKYGQQISLSPQQIVDCYRGKRDNSGCLAGVPSGTFMNIIEGGGIESESNYPYTAVEGSCAFDSSKVAVRLADCTSYYLTSQDKLKQLLYATGPIVVAINATTIKDSYNNEVVSNCGTGTNHNVLLIGYGTDRAAGDYWLLLNSWGPSFGSQGTFRIERGEGKNSCGIMNNGMASATLA